MQRDLDRRLDRGGERPWLAGVDGCRAGWIAVSRAGDPGSAVEVQLWTRFRDLLAAAPRPAVIAVDMPIGLLDSPQRGGRACDRLARTRLGRRASSVFSPPSRGVLEARCYAQVRGAGLSRQAFGILPKVREVDRVMTPALQDTVFEAHPELAFGDLAGQPMRHNKKTRAGQAERLAVLERASEAWGRGLRDWLQPALDRFPRRHVAPDDLLDAAVLLLTAGRIATAQARRLPAEPPLDRLGLRMEIWF